MKQQVKYRRMGILFLAMCLIWMIPVRALAQDDGNSMKVLCISGSEELVGAMAGAYLDLHPETQISIQRVDMSQLAGSMAEADLAVVGKGCLASLGEQASIRMVLGRDVIVPVISTHHPQYKDIMEKGMSREAIAGIYTGEINGFHPMIPADPCYRSYLEEFVGMSLERSTALIEEDMETMTGQFRKDPLSLGFCNLACLVGAEQGSLPAGISLVPLDLDGSGTIDSREEFYGSVPELKHAIFLGKYPASLYGRIYAIPSSSPCSEEVTAFMTWATEEGQEVLAAQNVLALDPSERLSAAHLLLAMNETENPESEASGNAFLWPLVFGVVFLLLIWGGYRLSIRAKVRAIPVRAAAAGRKGEVPAGYYFDKSHTWAYMEKDGSILVGVDAFILDICGPLSRISLRDSQDNMKKGKAFLHLKQDGKQLEIMAPVSGKILEMNPELEGNADALNSDPYGLGWICRVEPSSWVSEIRSFFMASRYEQWIREEMDRLKAFLVKEEMVLQDGGEPAADILKDRSPEEWEDFQTGFLHK